MLTMCAQAAVDFDDFARRKEAAAATARLERFETLVDRSGAFTVESIHSDLTDSVLDGPFFQSLGPQAPLPVIGLVFVQSCEGNTAADDPSTLGGGQTDKHLIYEGLSRVAADAVVVGAKTVGDGNLVFSTWHPALVAIRRSLRKPRHPTQIVASLTGSLPIETGLLFNVPAIPVMIVSAGQAAVTLAARCRSRPWITVISSGKEPDLCASAARLRSEAGIDRISAIGGRTLATALLDAGLITDLYLTTAPIPGGTPNTPMYAGEHPPRQELVVRKQSAGGVIFEHFVLRQP